MRVRDITRFVADIQKPVSWNQKIRPLLEREALKIEYLRESLYLFPSDFIAVWSSQPARAGAALSGDENDATSVVFT